MRRLGLVLLLAASAWLGGCASVAGGNVQKMYVQAQGRDGAPVEGADCVLSNDKGNWRLRTPGDTSVVRSNKPIEVKCDKASLPQGIVSAESGTRAAMFGNIIIGGVVGAVIDHSSGAAYEYPEQIRVVMGQMTSLPWTGNAKAPPPSGFAALGDTAAVPHLGPRSRERYHEWTQRANPKAFAIAPDGHFFAANGTSPSDKSLPSDPIERALTGCEKTAKMPCKLYAVNDNVVWVKEAAAVAPAPAPAPVPAASAAAAAPAPAPMPAPAHIASGYAALDDVDAVPYLSDRGRKQYVEYLSRPTPKAFAISTKGHWFLASTLRSPDPTLPSEPTERALAGCERAAQMPCKLYAVNGSVVWKRETSAAAP
jgi:hypothetical protein